MTDFNKIILGISIVCVIAALIYRIVIVRRQRAGDAGEKKRVSRVLRTVGRVRGFEVLDDVVLADEGLTGWADHIVVGYFGVLLVYDLTYTGHYSGKLEDEKWLFMVDGATGRVQNPFPLSGPCAGRVNTLLKKAGLKMPVMRAVVVTGRDPGKKTQLFIPSEDVMLLRSLRGYLNKGKFDADCGVEPEKAVQALRAGIKNE